MCENTNTSTTNHIDTDKNNETQLVKFATTRIEVPKDMKPHPFNLVVLNDNGFPIIMGSGL